MAGRKPKPIAIKELEGNPGYWAFPGKKEQTITMIKVLFICHGRVNGLPNV